MKGTSKSTKVMFEKDPDVKDIGIQSHQVDSDVSISSIRNCEKDPVVPWSDPSFQRPMCSWASFPTNPSDKLVLLVDLFDKKSEPQNHYFHI